MAFHYIDHPADIAVLFTADSLPGLFESLLEGWQSILFDNQRFQPDSSRELVIEAPGPEELCISFLQEINYLHQVHNILSATLSDILLSLHPSCKLLCRLSVANTAIPNPTREIKAITYHQAQLAHDEGLYSIQIIFDI